MLIRHTRSAWRVVPGQEGQGNQRPHCSHASVQGRPGSLPHAIAAACARLASRARSCRFLLALPHLQTDRWAEPPLVCRGRVCHRSTCLRLRLLRPTSSTTSTTTYVHLWLVAGGYRPSGRPSGTLALTPCHIHLLWFCAVVLPQELCLRDGEHVMKQDESSRFAVAEAKVRPHSRHTPPHHTPPHRTPHHVRAARSPPCPCHCCRPPLLLSRGTAVQAHVRQQARGAMTFANQMMVQLISVSLNPPVAADRSRQVCARRSLSSQQPSICAPLSRVKYVHRRLAR